MKSPEENLVLQAQRGDRVAFGAIYEAYYHRIYRYAAVQLGNPSDAEDVTEQVFLKALESMANFQWRDVTLAPWLFRIARNQVIDHVRRKAKREGVFPLQNTPRHERDPAELVEKKLDLETLKAALDFLTDAQRSVVTLRFIADLSIAETARALGKTEGAVKAMQHSALLALRKILAAPLPQRAP